MRSSDLGTVLVLIAALSGSGCAASSGVDAAPAFKPLEVGSGGGSQATEDDPSGGTANGGNAGAGACKAGEEETCYSGDPSTLGVGTCVAGKRVCENGAWGGCVGEVLPSTELCDGLLDENCDGQIDEGCCVMTEYDKETGLVSGSGTVCCDSGDQLIGAQDCGVGNNHTHSVDGDCASAAEGAGNDGSACVRVTCQKKQCQK